MGYVALYRAYRPQAFREVFGQEHIKKTLLNALKFNKIAHAYLFSGPRGTGKTSVAKILAKAVNCINLVDGEPCNTCDICVGINRGVISDVIEIDAASNNGVDEIREIRERVKYLPSLGKYKVYIIDEVHMLSTGAFNALLKTLEEPPAHAIFILATTEPHKIPATILSRCQRFDFKAIQTKEIEARLKDVIQKENIKIAPEAVSIIAESAEGGMRDALSLLDQAISYSGDEVSLGDVFNVSGNINTENLISLSTAIFQKETEKILTILEMILAEGKEISKLNTDLIAFYRDILLYKNHFHVEEKNIYRKIEFIELSSKISQQKIYFYLNVLNEAQNNMRWTNQKRIYLEMALIKMSDHSENIQSDLETKVILLENKVNDLLKNSNNSNNVSNQPNWLKKKASTTEVEAHNYEEIKSKDIVNVLCNGSKVKKAEFEDYWQELKVGSLSNVTEKLLVLGKPVAASDNELIIIFDDILLCEQLMRAETKVIALEILKQTDENIINFYAIPTHIWDQIVVEFGTQYRNKIARPDLDHINIGVKIYPEAPKQDSKIAKKMKNLFGSDIVEIKENKEEI